MLTVKEAREAVRECDAVFAHVVTDPLDDGVYFRVSKSDALWALKGMPGTRETLYRTAITSDGETHVFIN